MNESNQSPYHTPAPGFDPQTAAAPRQSNTLGLIGFIISLSGCCLVITAPLGLLLSFFALFKAPRLFAILGTIIGLIGTAILAGSIALLFSVGAARSIQHYETFFTGLEIFGEVMQHFGENNALPGDAEGQLIVNDRTDGWGTPIKYTRIDPTTFELRSAGPDTTFNTEDDYFKPIPLK